MNTETKQAADGESEKTVRDDDVDEDKLNAVADFAAMASSFQFRDYLFDLAKGQAKGEIKHDLFNYGPLKRYLSEGKLDELTTDELERCAVWGLCVAKALKNESNPRKADLEIVSRLLKRTDCRDDGGGGPIGG